MAIIEVDAELFSREERSRRWDEIYGFGVWAAAQGLAVEFIEDPEAIDGEIAIIHDSEA